MAMRGHASIQGSTDVPTMCDMLPGYLMQPSALRDHNTLHECIEKEGVQTGYLANMPKFIVSLLQAWYGESGTKDNEFGFGWVPRIDDIYSIPASLVRIAKGGSEGIKGMFLLGQNAAAGTPNSKLTREALKQLKWMVILDLLRN